MDKGDSNSPTKCLYKQEKKSFELIAKIVPLLEHPITKDDVQRHTEMISNFIDVSQHGFFIQDLPDIIQLIYILTDRIDVTGVYEKLLERILVICCIPPLLNKSSDVLTFARDLRELFTALGYLLVCLKNNNLRNIVVNALINLLKNSPKHKWYSSLESRKKAADDSRLSEILGQLLAVADDEIYSKLLTLITLMIKDCKNSCKELLLQDALNSLLRRIEPTWRGRYRDIHSITSISGQEVLHYDITSFIIYELLDYLEKHRADLEDVRNIDRFSIWNIQYAFKAFVVCDKKLDRNNVLAMKIKLMDLFPKAEFIASGLCESVLEVTTRYISSRKLFESKYLSCEDDYILLKLALLDILMVAELDGGKRVLEAARIIHTLLRSIWRTGEQRFLSKSHFCVIQIFFWNILKKLVPHLSEEFIENSGPSMLARCMKESKIKQEGLTILRECLSTTNHLLKNDPGEVIAHSFLYNDGSSILLNLCEQFLSEPIITEPMQTCLRLIFCIFNELHQSSTDLPVVLVEISLKYFKRILNLNLNEMIFDNKIIICLMDFVWETIIKSENLSKMFIESMGVYMMLDIIQKFPFPVQLITLGALVDLCEDESCVPYLLTWKGTKNVKFIPLLMQIFRYENNLLQVKCGSFGQILDAAFPLVGKEQRDQTFSDTRNLNSHPTIADLFLSSRPKIYALLKLLQERHEEVLKIAEEEYKIEIDDLTTKDRVTMLMAENFLALKLGEAWVELEIEFTVMNFKPLPADYKIMSTLVTRYHKWGEYLKETQNEIFREGKEKELIEEQKLYNTFGQSRIKESLEALEELRYIARCTEHMFRISQKYKQQSQIEKSLKKIPFRGNLNKTYFTTLQVTPVFNQEVTLKSEKTTEHEEETINLVSPGNSLVLEDQDLFLEDTLISQEFETLCS
nr:cilia- and flagella-associated protein 69-like [Leptinotarsa decemlineata]